MKTLATIALIWMGVFTVAAQAPKTFKSIEEALRKPDAVKILDLRGQGLKAIPDELALCTNLEKIDLTGNELAEFPAVLSKFKKLKILFLTNNQLRSLGNINTMTTLLNLKTDNNPFVKPNEEFKKTEHTQKSCDIRLLCQQG